MSINLREQSSVVARLLHIIDCFIVIAYLWLLVSWYRVPWSFYYSRLAIFTFLLCLVSFQSFQLYRSWRGWKFYSEFIVILKAWGAVIGPILFYFFIFKISIAYSRVVFLIWSFTTPFLIFALHVIFRKLLRYFRSKGKNVRRAVVAGAGDLGKNLVKEIESIPWAGIEILGFFDDKVAEDKKEEMGKPIFGDIAMLPTFLKEHSIDYVYIALPMRAERKIFSILRECRSLGARIYLLPDLYVFGIHHAEVQSLGKMLLLNFNPHTEWKRSFDVLFSILALIVTLPITLTIGMLIKLNDGGPVFYKQRRITSAGKEFSCYKFRSMCVGADKKLENILTENAELKDEWEKKFKLKNDPRVTKIGKFIRRTSLDEIPQFFNVIRGDMSVVGARPIVGHELNNFYKESAGRYCSMKPGITGPWQVGKRSDIVDYNDRVKLDDWYILNYSLWTDIKIIIKTVVIMFKGNGSY